MEKRLLLIERMLGNFCLGGDGLSSSWRVLQPRRKETEGVGITVCIKCYGWVAVNGTHKLTEGEETFPRTFRHNALRGDQNSLCVKEKVRHRINL